MNELMQIFRSTTVAMWMSWHRLTHGLKPDHKSVALETVSVVEGGPEMQEPELKSYSEVIQFLDFQTARYTNSVVCRAETLARLDNILEVFDGQIETDPKRGLAIIRHTSVSEKHELIWKILELLNLAIFENPLSLYQENEGVATSCTLSLLSLRRSVFMLFEGILDDENVRRSEIFIEMVYDEYVARRMYDTILDRRIRRVYGLPAIMAAEYLVNLLASDV